jgi:hypothetical protein
MDTVKVPIAAVINPQKSIGKGPTIGMFILKMQESLAGVVDVVVLLAVGVGVTPLAGVGVATTVGVGGTTLCFSVLGGARAAALAEVDPTDRPTSR